VSRLKSNVWVPNWSSMSCDLGIFVDQSAEPVVTVDAKVGLGRRRWDWPKWCCVLQGAVGAVLVEMRGVLGQYVFDVAPVEDQYSVEQLAADGADPAFGDRVRSACSHRWAQNADAFAGENGIEGVSELAVAIPDQEPELSDAVVEVHQQITRLLSDPRCAVMRRDPQEMDPAGGMLHDEQHGQPLAQQRGPAQKKSVARMPCAWAARNCRQVGPSRRGAGSMPARLRIDHTVLGAIG